MRIVKPEHDYSHLVTIARWIFDEWGHYRPDEAIADVLEYIRGTAVGELVPSLYVAEVDGVPVGTASIVECDLPLRSEYTPWLASVVVAADFRNRGVASELVTHIEKVATKSGIERLFLFTTDAEDLYARLGWERLEQLEYRGETITVMYRDLTDLPGDKKA